MVGFDDTALLFILTGVANVIIEVGAEIIANYVVGETAAQGIIIATQQLTDQGLTHGHCAGGPEDMFDALMECREVLRIVVY